MQDSDPLPSGRAAQSEAAARRLSRCSPGGDAAKTGDNLPRTIAYYLERVATCDRLADQAASEENKQIFLMLAARWRALDAEEESHGDH